LTLKYAVAESSMSLGVRPAGLRRLQIRRGATAKPLSRGAAPGCTTIVPGIP
jgi:hypothetical protein